MTRKGKNLFDFFPDNSKEEILKGYNGLTDKSKKTLVSAFGDDLDNRDNWLNLTYSEKNRINSIVNSTLKKKIIAGGSKVVGRKKSDKTNNKKFDKDEEIISIKKAKLSYYNEVSDDLKELYFKYYCDVFPLFKIKYENSSEKEKKVLLNDAIVNSKKWRDKFVEDNEGLVGYVVAKLYTSFYDELFQEGCFGLIEALKRFDLEKGLRFSSYAFYWIRRYVIRYYNKYGSIVRIPVNTAMLFNKLKKIQADFYQKYQSFPDDDVLAELGDCSLNMVKQFKEYTIYVENPIEFDAPVSDEGKATYENFVEDDKTIFADDVDNDLMVENIIDWVNKNIHDERAKYIIIRKYGLDGQGPHTYRQIASELGISAQRVYTKNKQTIELIQEFWVDENELLNKYNDILALKILKLHYIFNMSYEKIAGDLGMDLNVVIDLANYALEKLKSKYEYKNGKILKKTS